MLVHLFGATSSPSCATAALQKTAEDNKEHFSQSAIKIIHKSFYVDDCLASVDTTDKAEHLVTELINLCKRGGFRLTKWISNSPDVMLSIPTSERVKEARDIILDKESLPCERALGVHWAVETDTIGFNIKAKDQLPTRRGILSTVSFTFDPLGLASLFILNAKTILQNLCKQGVTWDEEVAGENLQACDRWCAELPLLENLHVTRCYKPAGFGKVSSCQLHIFSDSSEQGYGIASYLRFTTDQDQRHCAFILGRSRVAPLKKVTTPRMELTAATVAVRTASFLLNEIEYSIDDTFYWTNSMAVLRYIANETARFHTFVANRISVIREATDVRQWHYVDTKVNPADCASRGMAIGKLLQHKDWLQGPDFLWESEEKWPSTQNISSHIDASDPEVKKIACATTLSESSKIMTKLMSYHSDWKRLKNTVGWLLVAMSNLKRKSELRKFYTEMAMTKETDMTVIKNLVEMQMKALCMKPGEVKTRLAEIHLTPDIYANAEKKLLQYEQRHFFENEIEIILNNRKQTSPKSFIKKTSPVSKLDPIMVDGLLRVGGRLDRADIVYDAKHPIILSKDSCIAPLIVKHIHQSVGHQGKNAILNILRQKYWITGANSLIKTLLSKCVICRRYQARAGQQKMADLPVERVIPDQPCFSSVGMDFFGPITVKRGRSQIKRYGVVFTCLKSSAVHLEVASSLDTGSCINAIRRFISRRGPVKVIQSDNGTNLVGSQRELQEEIDRWNQSKIQRHLLKENITWIFNPPSGSHFGGVWERIIRSVRKILYSLLREQNIRLDDESLQTLFCEVEAILNNRPITTISNQPGDIQALTPNHLLTLQPGEQMPPGIFSTNDCYVRRRWRQVQYLADQFWNRWSKDYLPLLQERQKWCLPKKNLQINDIVLVVENSPRNSWGLGRIVEIMKDKKGFVRIVKVKTKISTLLRPIDKLCLLLEADYYANHLRSVFQSFDHFDHRLPFPIRGPAWAGMLLYPSFSLSFIEITSDA